MEWYLPFDPMFCMTEEGLNPDATKQYEGLFTQGSGYLHTRGSLEEGLSGAAQDEEYMRMPANVTVEKPRHPRSKWGTYIPGVTGLHPLLKEELVNLPYIWWIRVCAEGEWLDVDTSKLTRHRRILDMRDGVLYRSFDWSLQNGSTLQGDYVRYLSRSLPHVAIQRVTYRVRGGGCHLRLQTGIEEHVKTNGYEHMRNVCKQERPGGVSVRLKTDNGDEVYLCSRVEGKGLRFLHQDGMLTAELDLERDCEVTFYKLTYAATSRDPEGGIPEEKQIEALLGRLVKDPEALYAPHAAAWKKLWSRSQVIIDGDSRAQYAVNFCIYHLMRAVNEADSRIAICAKGFAGEAYFGHFFWDTEIYLLPFFLYTNQNAAKALMEFRIRTLPGAQKNAKAYGYPGARYPWESSVSGEEQCPNWQYADHEVHVTADVVHGLWHYYQATGDKAFLKEAAPVFVETARYWLKRMEHRADGTIHINGVMGPDEYTCFCDDNTYTNWMVAKALHNTLQMTALLEKEEIPQLSDQEREQMRVAVQQLCNIPRAGIIPQCRDFERLEELDFQEVWPDRTKHFGAVISQEQNYRSKALKQADVLMLPYLFPSAFDDKQMEENYDYYYPYTTHDSSLSCIVHSILCARLGRMTEAYRLFRQALNIDLDDSHKGAAEGIHIANCGGIWQAVLLGFGGMEWSYESDRPHFHPHLPPHWREVSFPLLWKGKRYQVRLTQDKTFCEEVR